MDPTEFRSLYSDTTQFPDPSHGEFINAITYDNTADNPTSVEGNRKSYDSNRDDIMWIDSEADVDNDRHRILVLVKRLKIPVELPDVALVANTAGGNGQGLDVSVDPDYTGSIPIPAGRRRCCLYRQRDVQQGCITWREHPGDHRANQPLLELCQPGSHWKSQGDGP